MAAKVIDGKEFAASVRAQVAEQVSKLKDEHNIIPGLAVVLVGEDAASQVYVRNKHASTIEVGMNSYEHRLSADTTENVGMLSTGQKSMVPCTPLGCLMMLRDHHGSLSGLNAVVVGRSNIVGKPMANLLLRDSCTVTIAHSRTKNIEAVCRTADIVIAAVGRPEMITGDWIADGATVIDVGINRIPHPDKEGKFKLVGDVDFASASAKAL